MNSKTAISVLAFCLAWPGWSREQSLKQNLQEYLRRTPPFDSLKESNRLQIDLRAPFTDALVAFFLRDTLRLYAYEEFCPVSGPGCGGCSLSERLLAQLPLPRKSGSASPILGIGYNASYDGWLGAMTAYPDGKAYRWGLDLASGRVASVRLDSFSLAGAGEPRFVLAGPMVQGSREVAFTLVRSAGSHYWVDRNGMLHGLTGPSYDFLSQGQGWLGRYDGGVSRIDYTSAGIPMGISEAGRPFPFPIHLIDSSGALSREGQFALRESGNAWRAFPVPAGDYSGFRVIRDSRGTGVELYVKSGSDSLYVLLQDKPTIFAIRIGNGAIPAQSPMSYDGPDSMRAVVDLKDPEGNFGSVILRKIRGRDTSILVSHLATPGEPWGCLGYCPQGNPPPLTIRLSPESLAFALPVFYGYLIHPSDCIDGIYEGKNEILSSVQPWRPGDTLELASNGDRFDIIYAAASAIRRPEAASYPFSRRVSAQSLDALGRRFSNVGKRILK